MTLRKAAFSDLKRLQKICIEAYTLNFHNHWEEGGLVWYLDQEFSEERLMGDLNDTSVYYYFILYKKEIVGFSKLTTNDDPVVNSVIVEKIYVLPEYKGLGIGKAAMRDIINIAKNKGAKSIFLCVIDTNLSAIAFYKSLGFTFHSNTTLDIPYFKEELKGMLRLTKSIT